MAGFPKIPLVLGDTDDDASIHLNSKVGPAKPLPPLKHSDREILKILGDANDTHRNHDEYHEFNKNFEVFKRTGKLPEINGTARVEDALGHKGNDFDKVEEQEEDEEEDQDYTDSDQSEQEEDYDNNSDIEEDEEDYDEDATEVESIQSSSNESQKLTKSIESPRLSSSKDQGADGDELTFFRQYKNLMISVVVIVLIEIIIITSYKLSSGSGSSQSGSANKMIENYYEINSKFNKIDDEIAKISQINSNLIGNQELLVQNYHDMNNNINATINAKFQELTEQITKFEKKLPTEYDHLRQDFTVLQKDFHNFKSVTNFTDFNEKLTVLGDKLSHLSALNDDFESIKSEFLQSFMDSLPNHLPIYIKNNKIHYIPEFNKFLYNFIDSYAKENPRGDWNQFLKSNKEQLKQYVGQIMEESGISGMNKQGFQKILNEKLSKNNQVIFDKFNNLIDQLNVSGNGTDNYSRLSLNNGDELFLSNLLDVFAKGSINTNYADYKLGSRILGFLTSISGASDGGQGKSLNRKLFLGWYDYLVSSSPSSKQLKYNANNLLIDGGESWHCNSQTCSVGIRLSNSVILSDLVIKSINLDHKPNSMSIYIRPNSKSQYNSLLQYLQDFKIPTKFKYGVNSSINDKYLSKFIKIKEMILSNERLDHVKLPVSLINLRIPVKDIYIEFHNLNSMDKKIEVFNVKAYGISEYNSYKFNNEFNLLIDNLQRSIVNDQNHDMYTSDNDGSVTIDDEFDISILGEE